MIPPLMIPSLSLAAGCKVVELRPAGSQLRPEQDRPYPRSPEIRYSRPAGGMPVLNNPARTAAYVLQYCRQAGVLDDPREHAYVLALNIKYRVLCDPYLLSIGMDRSCIVSAASTYRFAIAAGAGAIVLVHTHPSGDVTPSQEDQELTRKIVLAGELMDTPMIDHLILAGCHRTGSEGEREYFSFKEAGRL